MNRIDPMKPKKILGISPGVQVMAMALAQEEGVLEWRLSQFKGKWCQRKLEAILATIEYAILSYNIDTIAVKFPHESRRSRAVDKVFREIKNLAKKRKVKMFIYNYEDLRNEEYSPKHTTVRPMQKLNEAAACALKASSSKNL